MASSSSSDQPHVSVHKLLRTSVSRGDVNIYASIYSDTSIPFRGLWHLMRKWRGSVFKLVWRDVVVFGLAYAAISAVYRTVLVHHQPYKQLFEIVCVYASRFRSLIPITFLTGFYVSQVVSRYWDQFFSLPYPDSLAYKLVAYIPGQDHFRRNLRRSVVRYVNLSTILTFRLVSARVLARFPDLASLVSAHVLLPEEAARLEAVARRTPHEVAWAPMLWAQSAITWARGSNRIQIEAPVLASLIGAFDSIEARNRKLLGYGWVNFPLAYTQVATLSVLAYFVASLFAAQYLLLDEDNSSRDRLTLFTAWPNVSVATSDPFRSHTPDLFVPVFTLVELVSYLGWIKVAEALLNPFGDDDDDLDINYLLDRNFQVSYMIVDEAEMRVEVPEDPFLQSGAPAELPAAPTTASATATASTEDRDNRAASQSVARRLASFAGSRRKSRTVSSVDHNSHNKHSADAEHQQLF